MRIFAAFTQWYWRIQNEGYIWGITPFCPLHLLALGCCMGRHPLHRRQLQGVHYQNFVERIYLKSHPKQRRGSPLNSTCNGTATPIEFTLQCSIRSCRSVCSATSPYKTPKRKRMLPAHQSRCPSTEIGCLSTTKIDPRTAEAVPEHGGRKRLRWRFNFRLHPCLLQRKMPIHQMDHWPIRGI